LVAVPLYNHGATVRDVVQRCLKQHQHVVVVDDGSSDGGAHNVADLPVTLLTHEHNRGKGEAILTAADYARDHGFSHLVTIDADAQHHPEDLPLFFAAIEAEPLAIYVGLRDFTSANIPKSSRFGRQFSNFWLRVETGCKLGDVQSGYRAYPVQVLDHPLPINAIRLKWKCWLRRVGREFPYMMCRFRSIMPRVVSVFPISIS
jgi:glycosyltransferase involved in cell wall biosynthesis